MKKYLILLLMLPVIFSTGHVLADSDWYSEGGLHLLQMPFNGSEYYKYMSGVGVYISSDYLERAGFIIGYNSANKQYKSNLTNIANRMTENIVYLGVKGNLYLDSFPGKLSLRLDGYTGQDKYTGFTINVPGPMGGSTQNVSVKDSFTVINPTISFLTIDKLFYLDLGYAQSKYKSKDSTDYNLNITHPKRNILPTAEPTDNITISQWTPTVGFGINHALDWLQLRGYLIEYSSSNRVDYKKSTSAIEAKWIHWLSNNPFLGIDSISLSILSGQRIYAVDSDSYSLYNSADIQESGIGLGAKWKIKNRANIIVHIGHDKYKNTIDDDSYSSSYLFLQGSTNW